MRENTCSPGVADSGNAVRCEDPGVSLELLVQGLLAAGATQREIALALAPRKKALSA